MAEYFYIRITREERGKQKSSRQESALKKYADANGLQFDEHTVFREECSGESFTDRAEWSKLEKILRDGDTVVFKDISRFTKEAENGYQKYMLLIEKGVILVFLDNQTLCTDYIKQLFDAAEKHNFLEKISLENIVKLLMHVELDRAEQERRIRQKRIKEGMDASEKKPGRKEGTMEKLTPELEDAIMTYLRDGSVLQVDIMKEYHISRNTLKKYARLINEKLNQRDEKN